MSFEWPSALAALAVVPLAIGLYVRRDRRRTAFAARFVNPALLPNLIARSPGRLRHLPFAVLVTALAAMIVGVARPHATVSVQREEATVLLAVDVSRSMTATDVQPTRLDVARIAAARFLAKVPKRFRVGVLSIGTKPVIALPPTEDRELAQEALNRLRPSEGTALGDGVVLAVRISKRQRLPDGTVPPSAVLVISDGAQEGGRISIAAAARQARAARMPVSTIVVGTPGGTVTVTLPSGLHEIIRVPPNPDALAELARATGGQAFTAPDDPRLRDVYDRLGSRLGSRKERRELTDLFAAGSGVLLLAGGALSMLWFRRLP
jgi:Ca-activated chloride channel family protein